MLYLLQMSYSRPLTAPRLLKMKDLPYQKLWSSIIVTWWGGSSVFSYRCQDIRHATKWPWKTQTTLNSPIKTPHKLFHANVHNMCDITTPFGHLGLKSVAILVELDHHYPIATVDSSSIGCPSFNSHDDGFEDSHVNGKSSTQEAGLDHPRLISPSLQTICKPPSARTAIPLTVPA